MARENLRALEQGVRTPAELPAQVPSVSELSIHHFSKLIERGLDLAYEGACPWPLITTAKCIVADASALEECELSYLALQISRGFAPRPIRKTLQRLWEADPDYVSRCPRLSRRQMQQAMRQASLSALALLMPCLDRWTSAVVASAVLAFFPHDEVRGALAQVTQHLGGPDLFLVASEVLQRLPDTYGYRCRPRRPAYYESCIQYLIDALPRLPIEQRAVIAYRLMRCAYLGDESEERLQLVMPFSTESALMRHHFTDEELADLRQRGLYASVAAELSGRSKR